MLWPLGTLFVKAGVFLRPSIFPTMSVLTSERYEQVSFRQTHVVLDQDNEHAIQLTRH